MNSFFKPYPVQTGLFSWNRYGHVSLRLLSSLRPWPGSARSAAATLSRARMAGCGTHSRLSRGSGSSPDRYVMVPSL